MTNTTTTTGTSYAEVVQACVPAMHEAATYETAATLLGQAFDIDRLIAELHDDATTLASRFARYAGSLEDGGSHVLSLSGFAMVERVKENGARLEVLRAGFWALMRCTQGADVVKAAKAALTGAAVAA